MEWYKLELSHDEVVSQKKKVRFLDFVKVYNALAVRENPMVVYETALSPAHGLTLYVNTLNAEFAKKAAEGFAIKSCPPPDEKMLHPVFGKVRGRMYYQK